MTGLVLSIPMSRRLTIASVALSMVGIGFAAESSTNLVKKPAGGKSADQASVIDDPLDFRFVSEGESMPIEPIGGGSAQMQVQFTRGRSAVDTEDPSKVVVYPYPFIWVVDNPRPIPDLPQFVRRVRQREGKILVDIVFSRWSRQFQEACKQHWIMNNREFLVGERKTRGIEGLEVVVKRPPLISLFMAIQEKSTGLTLAHAQQNTLRGPDELTYTFVFEPGQFEAFLRAQRDEDIVFQPIWRARMKNFTLGVLRVDAKINLKMTVEQKLASEGLKIDGPIDQITYDKITRDIAADMKSSIAVDHEEVLPLLNANLLLMEGILKPDGWMTWDDFSKARGPEADRVLAAHLEPHGLTLLKSSTNSDETTTTTGHETTKRDGGGLGFSLPFFGWSHSGDEQNRDINLVSKSTGIEFREGSQANTVAPHRIRSYRLSDGTEERSMHQTLVVQIGGENGTHFFKDDVVPPTINSEMVAASLSEAVSKAGNLSDLYKKRAEKFTLLNEKHEALRKSNLEMLSKMKTAQESLGKAREQFTRFVGHKYNAGRSHGMYEWLLHQRALWNMEPKDGGSWKHTMDGYESFEAQAKINESEASTQSKLVDESHTDINRQLETSTSLQKEIESIQSDITKLNEQIIAAARR